MNNDEHSAIPSRAQIAGHPIHPMLVPFPIAFLVGALASDLLFLGTNDAFWARASYYLILAGLVTGVVAAAFGFTDFATRTQVRRMRAAWIHFLGNALVLMLSLVNLLIRGDGNMAAAVLPEGLLLSAAVGGVLVVTGWMGGEMVYRHRVGVSRH